MRCKEQKRKFERNDRGLLIGERSEKGKDMERWTKIKKKLKGDVEKQIILNEHFKDRY